MTFPAAQRAKTATGGTGQVTSGGTSFAGMSEIYSRLRSDIISAVKGRESDKALALRTIDGAIQRASIDANLPIDDEMVLSTLRKAVKDLSQAREQFERGGRPDLVEKGDREAAWLEAYLPAQFDEARIEQLVNEAIAESGAQSKKEMGKVMGLLKKHPDAGLIDFSVASRLTQSKLA